MSRFPKPKLRLVSSEGEPLNLNIEERERFIRAACRLSEARALTTHSFVWSSNKVIIRSLKKRSDDPEFRFVLIYPEYTRLPKAEYATDSVEASRLPVKRLWPISRSTTLLEPRYGCDMSGR